jgi:putative acyl-CoA dehydrogenase
MCLDVLRALSREPRSFDALTMLLQQGRGRDGRYDQFVARLLGDLRDAAVGEAGARILTERIALATQASILLEGGSSPVADAFISSRIATGAPAVFGVLPALEYGALIERVLG